MEIEVRRRNVFGIDRYYPVCEKALQFAMIAGSQTLTPMVIQSIKKLGYKVIIPSKPEEL